MTRRTEARAALDKLLEGGQPVPVKDALAHIAQFVPAAQAVRTRRNLTKHYAGTYPATVAHEVQMGRLAVARNVLNGAVQKGQLVRDGTLISKPNTKDTTTP